MPQAGITFLVENQPVRYQRPDVAAILLGLGPGPNDFIGPLWGPATLNRGSLQGGHDLVVDRLLGQHAQLPAGGPSTVHHEGVRNAGPSRGRHYPMEEQHSLVKARPTFGPPGLASKH